jgi:ABC-type phosphate/phosphonate transport system ATPase subunit
LSEAARDSVITVSTSAELSVVDINMTYGKSLSAELFDRKGELARMSARLAKIQEQITFIEQAPADMDQRLSTYESILGGSFDSRQTFLDIIHLDFIGLENNAYECDAAMMQPCIKMVCEVMKSHS